MINEITMFYDEEKKEVVTENINFGPVEAGEETSKKLFVQNNIDYTLRCKFYLKDHQDEGIYLSKTFSDLKPGEFRPIDFVFSPKITKMKPIKAKLVTKISYIVE